jgi:hypothetical protein
MYNTFWNINVNEESVPQDLAQIIKIAGHIV